MSEENYDPFWDYTTSQQRQHEAHPDDRSPPELAPYVKPNRFLRICAKTLLITTCITVSTAAILRAMSDKHNVNRYLQRYVYRHAQHYASQYLPDRILKLAPKVFEVEK